jgi:hypothetical protein
VPAFSAVIWFSIFIASSTTTGVPTSTASPTATSTFTIVPCMGAITWPAPAPPPPSEAAGLGRALRAAPPAAAATGAPSGTHMATEKRRPSTSTSTERRTRGSASSPAGAGGAGAVTDDRSRRSSTHFVECSAAMKSGWLRIALWAGVVVATPSTIELVERPQQPLAGLLPVAAPHDQLGDEVVVVLADLVALGVAGVEAHERPVGDLEPGDGAGGGEEAAAARVLGVDPGLHGVAPELDVVLGERERVAGGDAQLLGHEVEAGDGLGDRVLDLEAGVHLEEEELAVLVQELDGAGVHVAAGEGDLHRRLAHRLADLGRERRGRALLEQLLVAALGRAVPLADPHGVAVGVGHDLHLDVAGPGQVALEVGLARPKEAIASRWADSRAPAASPAAWTTFIPCPPPP